MKGEIGTYKLFSIKSETLSAVCFIPKYIKPTTNENLPQPLQSPGKQSYRVADLNTVF